MTTRVDIFDAVTPLGPESETTSASFRFSSVPYPDATAANNTIPNDEHEDAALARKLQQELDDEALARRLQEETPRNNNNNNSSRSNRSSTRNSRALVVQGTPVTQPPRSQRQPSARRSSQQQQQPRGRQNRNVPPPAPPAASNFVVVPESAVPPPSSSRNAPALSSDEVYARKVEQELRDEALARHLTIQESQMRASAMAARSDQRCSIRRICSCMAGTLIIAAVVVTLLVVFAGGSGLNLIGMNPNFAQNDPQLNNSHVIPWNTHGSKTGLKLEVVNSLDSKWTTYFQTAVSQWDNGSPDALTLTTSQIAADSSCQHIMGKLKVCNGNYGDTQWLGINEQLLDGQGYMVSSAARMNDYYLDGAIDAQRQYTMCHEVGHGFGLPHTDENFYNKDLGNCLDYTIHPWVNEQPGAINYNRLAETYGTVVNGTRRQLLRYAPSTTNKKTSHPDSVLPEFTHALRRLHSVGHVNSEQEGWKVVHKSPYGEIHTRRLAAGYQAHVHIMLVTNQLKL